MPLAAILACLVILAALGLVERASAERARRAVPIRVHVNGTRGKSTVTRLVAAALREAGIPTLGKVTGTAPRLLLPDGTERPIRRRGPANVREQVWALRQARRLRVRALVAECMAVRPDLQWTSEHDMLHATIGVITNVRQDHGEVMGTTLADVAQSLANTTPANAVLVIPNDRFLPLFRRRAAERGTRVVVTPAPEARADEALPEWLEECRTIALAVTRLLGIEDGLARAGMKRATADPGAARLHGFGIGAEGLPLLDVTAANDPDSCDRLVAASPLAAVDPERQIFVYNHRSDRPERLRQFATASASFLRAGRVFLTGDRPAWTLGRAVRRARGDRACVYVPVARLAAALPIGLRPGMAPEATGNQATGAIIFAGNTRGFDLQRLMTED